MSVCLDAKRVGACGRKRLTQLGHAVLLLTACSQSMQQRMAVKGRLLKFAHPRHTFELGGLCMGNTLLECGL